MRKRKAREKLEKLLVDVTEGTTERASCSEKAEYGNIIHLSQVFDDQAFRDNASSLLETIQTISSVVYPRQPAEEFTARVSNAVQERFQSQVSKEKIQKIIGKAVTDEEFRRSLFQDVVVACHDIGVTLKPREIAALRSLKEDAVRDFSDSLDERISKIFTINMI